MDIQKYNYLNNYLDLFYIYNNFESTRLFLNKNDNNTIMGNIDKFITLFKNDFKIDNAEQRFILSCIFEFDMFREAIKEKISTSIYRRIIVKKVSETLNDIIMYSDVIENSILLCNLNLDDDKKINQNYTIIKKIIKNKEIKYNYCFLFDNINYYKHDINKLKSYIAFVDIILGDYLNTKSYY